MPESPTPPHGEASAALAPLLERNKLWVAERTGADPDFFTRQAARHEPRYLWIGCSDARVPANVITRTDAGEMFVHRNIANLVRPHDQNLLAVLQFAIEVLRVQDVLVCGHEGCGGVRASVGPTGLPHLERWLDPLRQLRKRHAHELAGLPDDEARHRRMVALNAAAQVSSLASLPVVRAAWARGAVLRLHAIVYDIADGVLRDLGVSRAGP